MDFDALIVDYDMRDAWAGLAKSVHERSPAPI